MEDKSAVLAEVCAALTGNQSAVAADILRDRYPFVPLVNVGRRYSVRQAHNYFVRDGFVDWYSGQRLVFPAHQPLISNVPTGHNPIPITVHYECSHFI